MNVKVGQRWERIYLDAVYVIVEIVEVPATGFVKMKPLIIIKDVWNDYPKNKINISACLSNIRDGKSDYGGYKYLKNQDKV